jgi:hypothetical protein
MIRDWRQSGAPSSTSGSAASSVTPGKRTLTESLPTQHIDAPSGTHAPGKRTLAGTLPAPALGPGADPSPPAGMWEHTFGGASTPVGKLARVQAANGVYLRIRPLPGAASSGAPVPFNGLVHVERRTTQDHASKRWCYVIAIDAGGAGFCEERYLAIDPPEPTAQLRRTAPGERLAAIAKEAFGRPTDETNSRLQVQALYLANRDRAGIQLDRVDLGLAERALRGADEEQTLKIYKGATVIAGNALWIPGKPFMEQLQAAGAATGGSTYAAQAWHTARDAVGHAVDDAKYTAGFTVGLLEGAYKAIVDLFKGAVDMLEAVLEVVWHLVTQNPGRIKDMVMGWADKMKLAWEHRGDIADDFLKKWNTSSTWDRGLFQGEVLGWLAMTVLLILMTMGTAAPGAIGGIAVRWPQLAQLLKTVDTLGDVTTYLGAAAKATKLPAKAADFVAGKLGKAAPGPGHATSDIAKSTSRTNTNGNNVVHADHQTTPSDAAAPAIRDGCFVAGTQVRTPAGLCAIEKLGIGTRVLAAATERSGTTNQAILQTFVHVVPIVLDVKIGDTTITCSPAHPFWIATRGWISAAQLRVADRLTTSAGTQVVIDEIVARSGTFTVYNITVEGLAAYHVSDLQVLVHNKPMKLDLRAIFNSRNADLRESIAEIRARVEAVKKLAQDPEDLKAIRKLEKDVNAIEREVDAAKFVDLPEGADPATHVDPLAHATQLDVKALKQIEDLEASVSPKHAIPADRPARDSETVLVDAKRFTPTGKIYDGRKIYRDGDGRFYYVDNLHKGLASEIEVFSRTGEHLGTMSPSGVVDTTKKVKGRTLKRNLL